MSILDPVQQSSHPVTAAMVAGHMKAQARGLHQMLVRTFNDGAMNFWKNPTVTPEQIAEALGTDGVELFQLHAKIGQLLASVTPESVAPGAAVIGTVVYGDDGKVTVTPKA